MSFLKEQKRSIKKHTDLLLSSENNTIKIGFKNITAESLMNQLKKDSSYIRIAFIVYPVLSFMREMVYKAAAGSWYKNETLKEYILDSLDDAFSSISGYTFECDKCNITYNFSNNNLTFIIELSKGMPKGNIKDCFLEKAKRIYDSNMNVIIDIILSSKKSIIVDMFQQ